MSRVVVHLTRKPQDFKDPASGFKPLGLPDMVEVLFPQLGADVLERAVVDFAIELAPGSYELPLSQGTPCLLDVPESCCWNGRAVVEAPDPVDADAGEGPYVSELDVEFSEPLVFRNILSTLDEVRSIFRDSLTSIVSDRIAGAYRLLRGVAEAGTGALLSGSQTHPTGSTSLLGAGLRMAGEQLETLGEIWLSGFRARSRRTWGGSRELVFKFDGDVALAGRVPVPFRRIRLPRFILPTLHATLENLLSDNPLGSGELLNAQIPWAELARVTTRTLYRFDASFSVVGSVPAVDVRIDAFDRSRLVTRVDVSDKIEASAVVTGEVENGELDVVARGVRVAMGSRELGFDVHARVGLDELVDLTMPLSPGQQDTWSFGLPKFVERTDGISETIRLNLTIREDSRFGPVRVKASADHQLAKGRTELSILVEELELGGHCDIGLDSTGWTLSAENVDLQLRALFELEAPSFVETGSAHVTPERLAGRVSGRVRGSSGLPLVALVDVFGDFAVEATKQLDVIPELSLHSGMAHATVDGRLALAGMCTIRHDHSEAVADFENSRLVVTLHETTLTADGMQLQVPKDTEVTGAVTRGLIGTSGLGELELGLSWDMRGDSPVLSNSKREAVLLVDELRRMDATLHISTSGRISFAGGGDGLYDGDYLNAIFYPAEHLEKWLDIIESEDAMLTVFDTVAVMSNDLERLARRGREEFLRAKAIADREGVKDPADIIPRDNMARLLSLILAEDDSLQARLASIIEQVTEAKGLNRRELESIINELYPDHGYAFELDRILRWLDTVLSPSKALPPPRTEEVVPLTEDPRFTDILVGVPSAAELYETVRGDGPIESAKASTVARVAPWLTLEQVDYLLERGGSRWPVPQLARLNYVHELKQRIDLVGTGTGGVGHAPQPTAIAFFLADVLEADARFSVDGSPKAPIGEGPLPCDGILGPEDVATLLQAGLTNVASTRTVQINQRILFNYIQRRPKEFFVGVLDEMGMDSPRVLTNVLMDFLYQDQQAMKEPRDMPTKLSGMLGVDIPRREDYMAGGRWAKDSYYKRLTRTAEYLLREATSYKACKLHLQTERHPIEAPKELGKTGRKLEELAKEAIADADELASQCTFDGEAAGPIADAKAAYTEAFAACEAVLARDRRAFQRGWFKRFWHRNYEALVIRSVLRNYQDDIDQVRYWLHRRTGRDGFENEQALLEGVVTALYHFQEDRDALLADPLCRLLIDPPEGRYNFTVVTAMGVITEGREGRELEDAWHRIDAAYGVKLLRADTGNVRTLEYNAERIIEAVEQVDTPYGLIGYSQGCANILMAEATLRGGTPRQQALLDGLRTRNFLFSAANGSAHGTCGNEKYLRAMVEGELFLKHYQALYSAAAIRNVQNMLSATLDAPAAKTIMGSVESLSHEGVLDLFRDGQYLETVPSATIRGIVFDEIVPEALEFLANVLTRQVKGALHDTQVTSVSAVGHSFRVTNPYADVLKRCDTGSYAQSTHHWSPLIYATEFVTTERDRAHAVYNFPKDRHVFPWIEVNARFGNIEVME